MISSKTTFSNDTNVVLVNTYKVNMVLNKPNIINMNLTKNNISIRQNSIAKQGPRGADGGAIRVYTTQKLPIINNKIILPFPSVGDVILNTALIYNSLNNNVATEYSCSINPSNSSEILFDTLDGLSGKYAITSYCILLR